MGDLREVDRHDRPSHGELPGLRAVADAEAGKQLEELVAVNPISHLSKALAQVSRDYDRDLFKAGI